MGEDADTKDELLNAVAGLIPPLLSILTALEEIQMRLDPARLSEYQEHLKPFQLSLENAAEDLRPLKAPENFSYPPGQLLKATDYILKGLELFQSADPGQAGVFKAFRAIRFFCRAQEALYPLASSFSPISMFFLEGSVREDETFLETLKSDPDAKEDGVNRGILNASNRRGQRGGFSLYVPESYKPDETLPLVVALHGGSGHGADFFWSWLTEARSRRCILMAPSSKGNTWSITQPGVDAASLMSMLNYVSENWNLDEERVLLTGLSDGGTFALLAGILDDSPFTHLAPVASAAHALTNQQEALRRLKDKRIFLVHGGRDWMFPVENARGAAEAFKLAGAAIVYHEIEDLSHNYPRDENMKILEWFLG